MVPGVVGDEQIVNVKMCIRDRPTTMLLAVLSVLLATAIGVPTGIISATKQYSIFDNLAMVLALVGVSMPNFWQGLVLILVFSVYLGILPPSGFYGPMYWILPAVTIGTSTAATITRMTRSSMPVSYTHLDVYKRQVMQFTWQPPPAYMLSAG